MTPHTPWRNSSFLPVWSFGSLLINSKHKDFGMIIDPFKPFVSKWEWINPAFQLRDESYSKKESCQREVSTLMLERDPVIYGDWWDALSHLWVNVHLGHRDTAGTCLYSHQALWWGWPQAKPTTLSGETASFRAPQWILMVM